MKYTIYLAALALIGCATVHHETITTKPDGTVTKTELNYGRVGNQSLKSLTIDPKTGQVLIQGQASKVDPKAIGEAFNTILSATAGVK